MKRRTEPSDEYTGPPATRYHTVVFPFGKYEIAILLGPGNEFARITEVSVRKDFRSNKQKLENEGYHDVSDFYEE